MLAKKNVNISLYQIHPTHAESIDNTHLGNEGRGMKEVL